MSDAIVICAAKRTAIGAFQGALSKIPASALGGIAIQGALDTTQCDTSEFHEVIMGCVLAAGQGQAPARQAAHFANIPRSVGATTINKMCGSGMKAIMLAHDTIQSGTASLMLAGGLESMSNAPYLMLKARSGYRLGHDQIKDHLFLDGLEDAYDKGKLMGCFAEDTATHYQFSREAQDEFSITSLNRAKAATEKGDFETEIVPAPIKDGVFHCDEMPQKAKIEKIPKLSPVFDKNGTVTAANSSSISDGAAALILASESYAKKAGLPILAKIVAHASHAQDPAWFTTAPVGAIKKVLTQANWQQKDIDLFEINEAFAVVTMAAISELNLNPSQVNVNGGACALGHPIGASGARIVVTLIHALQRRQLKRGIASLCIGGGEAVALAIEAYPNP